MGVPDVTRPPDYDAEAKASGDGLQDSGTGSESPAETMVVSCRDSQGSPTWDERRWATIIDRIEFRQVGTGLRFWGPPLCLEVTMTGPDSDTWWAAAAGDTPDQSWNWQSDTACVEAMRLVAAGADDDTLLFAVGRYPLENLILNTVHE